jgi:hypothetical protein
MTEARLAAMLAGAQRQPMAWVEGMITTLQRGLLRSGTGLPLQEIGNRLSMVCQYQFGLPQTRIFDKFLKEHSDYFLMC